MKIKNKKLLTGITALSFLMLLSSIVLTTIDGAFQKTAASQNYQNAQSGKLSPGEIIKKIASTGIPFIENVGQKDQRVKFFGNLPGGTFFVDGKGALTYNFLIADSRPGQTYSIRESFRTSKTVNPKGKSPSPAKASFFIGNNPAKWKNNVNIYNEISLGEVFKGINVGLRATGDSFEKIFTVLPSGNPNLIGINVDGASGLNINAFGELEAATPHGAVRFTKPVAYQQMNGEKKPVEIAYNIQNSTTYGFKLGTYDSKSPLVIDPVLASTYIGGTANDAAFAAPKIAIDSSGKIFVASDTYSTDYPATTGAYDETKNTSAGTSDGVVSRFSADLTALEASTYIGGTGDGTNFAGNEHVNGIAVDGSDNVFIAGVSYAGDYPTTGGAYDTSFPGNGHLKAFISKLSNDLTSLSASTALGGSNYSGEGASEIEGISMDSSSSPEKVLVTGYTSSTDFPVTASPFDNALTGGTGAKDAFASKLNNSLTSLDASTYIGASTSTGGTEFERGTTIKNDSSGNIYVAGYTNESDFPATSGAYDETWNGGGSDGFICKFNGSLGSSGAVVTYLGGSGSDEIENMAVTGSEIYIDGWTSSTNYPTISGAYATSKNASLDAIISKMSLDLTTLDKSTYLGGDTDDRALGIKIDGSGNLYVTGDTSSSDFPTTSGVYDTTLSGTYDSFAAKLNGNLDTLSAGTYLGGCGYDFGSDILLDGSGNVYLTGRTLSADYPTTSGAYDRALNGSNGADTDLFVTEINSTFSAGIPGKITFLTASPDNMAVTLNWCEPPGMPTGYTVEYGTTAGGVFDQTCSTASCTDATAGATVTNLTGDTEYMFRVTPINDSGTGEVSNTATATPYSPCPGQSPDQSCLSTNISAGNLSFTNIPDNTEFTNAQGNTNLPSYNNSSGTDSHDILSVTDLRDDAGAGFEVQLSAGTFISADNLNSIPLEYLYVASSLPRISGSTEDETEGIEYAEGCFGSTTNITSSVNAPEPLAPNALGTISTFTTSGSNLGSGNSTVPVVLMSSPASQRRCTVSQAVSYAIDLPSYISALGTNIPAGTYTETFTYTLIAT